MSISKEFTNEVLARVNIVEIIDEKIPLKKAGANYLACCPFHKEKTPSFSVNQNKQFYHCFGCGKSGNAITFLIEYERLNFVEAVSSLASLVGLQIPQQQGTFTQKQSHKNLYTLLNEISQYYQHELTRSKKAIAYLEKRGITKATIQHFKLGYAKEGWDNLIHAQNAHKNPETLRELLQAGMIVENQRNGYYDRFRDRLMFPILDRQGRIIGFGGRVFDDSTPKYLNSPETPIFHKGRELYGLYEASKANSHFENILIVEGYMDTIALAQYGITNVAATLGTATTPQHLERLFRYTSTVIFCFDGDKAGKQAAWRALQTALSVISEGKEVHFLFLPDNEDPDSLIQKEGRDAFLQRLKKETLPLSQFFFKHLQKEIDISSLDGKAKLIKIAKPYIDQMQKSLFQQMLIDELARITRVNSQLIFKENSPLPKFGKENNQFLKIKSPSSSRRLSPIRLAIALLLHHPQLATLVSTTNVPNNKIPGIDLLMTITQKILATPNITTAMLLEQWRDTEHEVHLHKLLQWESMIPETGIEKEFIGAINRIHQHEIEQEVDCLMSKAATIGLNEEEKIHLQNLMRDAKKMPKSKD